MPKTLSKAFDISRNTPRTSRVGSAWKAVYTSWTIDSNWYMHDLFGLKRDWCSESNFCSSRYSKRDLKISFSNIFSDTGNSETGLMICLSFFFFFVNRTDIWFPSDVRESTTTKTILENQRKRLNKSWISYLYHANRSLPGPYTFWMLR